MSPRKILLCCELALLYFGLPLASAFFNRGAPILPLLWGGMLFCLIILIRTPSFTIRQLFQIKNTRKWLPGMLLRIAVFSITALFITRYFFPDRFLAFPKSAPLWWGIVILLYPILSVIPQGIIYRAFFFHRYQPLFGSGTPAIILSAVVFAFAHIVFHNVLALIFTFAGGLILGFSYRRHGCLIATNIEHALYGDILFTVGLGTFFYHGAVS